MNEKLSKERAKQEVSFILHECDASHINIVDLCTSISRVIDKIDLEQDKKEKDKLKQLKQLKLRVNPNPKNDFKVVLPESVGKQLDELMSFQLGFTRHSKFSHAMMDLDIFHPDSFSLLLEWFKATPNSYDKLKCAALCGWVSVLTPENKNSLNRA